MSGEEGEEDRKPVGAPWFYLASDMDHMRMRQNPKQQFYMS
jgi:hypothetical protein